MKIKIIPMKWKDLQELVPVILRRKTTTHYYCIIENFANKTSFNSIRKSIINFLLWGKEMAFCLIFTMKSFDCAFKLKFWYESYETPFLCQDGFALSVLVLMNFSITLYFVKGPIKTEHDRYIGFWLIDFYIPSHFAFLWSTTYNCLCKRILISILTDSVITILSQ